MVNVQKHNSCMNPLYPICSFSLQCLNYGSVIRQQFSTGELTESDY
jgi:hypothetical protein